MLLIYRRKVPCAPTSFLGAILAQGTFLLAHSYEEHLILSNEKITKNFHAKPFERYQPFKI